MKAAGAAINEGLSPGGGPGSENGSHLGTPVHGHPHPTNGDLVIPAAKIKLVAQTTKEVKEYEQQYQDGLITSLRQEGA